MPIIAGGIEKQDGQETLETLENRGNVIDSWKSFEITPHITAKKC